LKVVSEYPQGWHLAVSQASGGSAIGGWRADPKVSGAANAIGDIGTHAENLCRYITGLKIDEVCAELTSFIPGHQLDDDGNLLVRFKGGPKGIIYASQVSSGDENNLNIRIYGTEGSLHWYQEHPNELTFKSADKPQVVYRRGNNYLSKAAQGASRIPFGHPEAFIEAFANVYVRAADAIADQVSGRTLRDDYDFPNIDDGVYGMAFIETVVKSARSDAKWTKFPDV
jgi:predicted dehydrogenase